MGSILNTIISTLVTITTFTFLAFRGGFPAVRINSLPASITNDDGTIQSIAVTAFSGFHVQNIMFSALIAIFIGVIFSVGIKEIWNSIMNDLANRKKDN